MVCLSLYLFWFYSPLDWISLSIHSDTQCSFAHIDITVVSIVRCLLLHGNYLSTLVACGEKLVSDQSFILRQYYFVYGCLPASPYTAVPTTVVFVVPPKKNSAAIKHHFPCFSTAGQRWRPVASTGTGWVDRPVKQVEKPVKFSILATKRHLSTNRNIPIFYHK